MNYDNVLQSLDIVALDPTLGVNHDDICAAGALAIRQLRAERDALRAQCYTECAAICRKAEDWSDGSLGWNRACKRMAIAIEHALADGKP